MKYLAPLFIAGLCLFPSCTTDSTGHHVYTGPTLNVQLGYGGATVAVGIVGQPSPVKATATVGDK